MILCPEMWEPDAHPVATHTCDLPDHHLEVHHCPACDSTWAFPGSPVWDKDGTMTHRGKRA